MSDHGKPKIGLRTKQKISGILTCISIVAMVFIIKREYFIREADQTELKEEARLHSLESRNASIFIDELGRIRIPPDNILDALKFRDLDELYRRYLESIQVSCTRQVHLGNVLDGGYDLCEHPKVIPSKPCMVYSFGIRDDFTFDDEISKRYGCEVHSFDPANGMEDHQHSTNVYFHATGIHDKDEILEKNMKMRTLQTIKKELGHTDKNIPILKIDIEGGEWISLPEILSSGSLRGVKQLIMEFHTYIYNKHSPYNRRNVNDHRQNLKILRALFDEGFRIFYFKRFANRVCVFRDEYNAEQTGCHEVHFMRMTD